MKYQGNIRVRKVTAKVKDQFIEYDEFYLVNENGEEVFDRNLEIDNDARLYDIYKKLNKLLTRNEIKEIRNKYSLTQKEYANVIGVGEITIHRFEKGAIQTDAVDAIMRLSKDVNNMQLLLEKNKENVSDEIYSNLNNKLIQMKNDKKHALLNLENINNTDLYFSTEKVKDVAENIIKKYNEMVLNFSTKYEIVPEYITNLKLQKLLYYVQGHCLNLFNKPAFNEKIFAWSYGPVIDEIYQEYKEFHANELKEKKCVKKLSNGLDKVIEEVVLNYGNIEASKLIDLTHEEEPWQSTKINSEIEKNIIKKYFERIYDI